MRFWIGGFALCSVLVGGSAHPDDIVVSRKNIFSLPQKLNLLTPTPIIDPDDKDGLLNVYGNELAKQAFEARAAQAPVGSIFVNEKTVSGKADAIGVMVKRAAGFDRLHGDWEYSFADQWGAFRNGILADCIACHQQAKSPDYVFYPGAAPKP